MTATEEGQKRPALKVVLMGHPYNTRDTFANRNLVRKLEALGLNAVFGDSLYATGKADKARLMGDGKLIKMPYWISLRENYGSAGVLRAQGGVDGAVYVSSFNCGPDSFIIEMVRERLGDLPLLVLKLDEQTGEAGLDTRLEAFAELLERRTRI